MTCGVPIDHRSAPDEDPPHPTPPHLQLNTRVELRFEVSSADWIPEGMRGRFLEQQRHRVNKAGEFVISSQEHRYLWKRGVAKRRC